MGVAVTRNQPASEYTAHATDTDTATNAVASVIQTTASALLFQDAEIMMTMTRAVSISESTTTVMMIVIAMATTLAFAKLATDQFHAAANSITNSIAAFTLTSIAITNQTRCAQVLSTMKTPIRNAQKDFCGTEMNA